MTIKINSDRQQLLVATVTINAADVASGVNQAAINLPPNAVIFAGTSFTTQAWNSGTSDVLNVGDAASANRYLAAGNIRAANALVPLVATGLQHAGDALTLNWTGVGAPPTTGSTIITVLYYVLGRANLTFG